MRNLRLPAALPYAIYEYAIPPFDFDFDFFGFMSEFSKITIYTVTDLLEQKVKLFSIR